MDTKYLRYFLQVCEDKSLSKASKNLYLSQQALSAVVRKLEDELQIPLFKRSKNGMVLTEYGECLRSQACKMIDTLNETDKKLEALKSGHVEVLNLGVSFGVISALPHQYISGFQKLYPNIELHITEYQDVFCEEAVLSEHEDIGFTIAPVDAKKFDSRTVIHDKMCLLVNEKNPLHKKQVVCFDEIKNESFLVLNNNFKIRQIFNEKCRQAGFTPHIELETMELILIHSFSRLNKSAGVSVDFIAHDISNVKPLPFEPECPWEVCSIIKKGKNLSQAEKYFVQYMEQFDCYYPEKDL